MRYSTLLFAAILFFPLFLTAQGSFPVSAPSDERPGAFAFTNATIYTDYKTKLDNATLIVREGKIVACGAGIAVPADAVVQDCRGKIIYPAFIDLYAGDYGLPAVPPAADPAAGRRNASPAPARKGAYAWNDALRPEYNIAENLSQDPKAADAWRKMGFGAVLTHKADGISRGTGALLALNDDKEHKTLLQTRVSHHLSFRKGSSSQNYPTSLMGSIALLRQTYLDGQWYKTEGWKNEQNLSLSAWNEVQNLPQIFEAGDKLDVLRIGRIGAEFGQKYIVKTAGDEYQRLDAIKALGYALIVPLNFPEGYDVRDPYDALEVSLKDLKHWEMAPANPARLDAAGLNFALTAAGLRDKAKFMENLRKAIEHGLSPEAALKALTYTPATLINRYNNSNGQAGIGSLESGKVANFIICTGDVFKAESKIAQTWVQGKSYDYFTPGWFSNKPESFGDYRLDVGGTSYTLLLKGKPEAPEAQVMRADSSKIKAQFSISANGIVTLGFQPDSTKKGSLSLNGVADGRNWNGTGTTAEGQWISWNATLLKAAEAGKGDKPGRPATKPEVGELLFPFTAFGLKSIPQPQTYFIRNATVWTSENDGVLENCDVLVTNGKIQRVGRKLSQPDNAIVVDGTGKHLTAGIIDEHSHIAASRGINEASQESTAEVRIADVIDSEDIDIYRQLAGGVTSSHILHGSANPIGGQTQLIKLRWGSEPEGLKFKNWPGYIKFALGENVKQSNFQGSTRYPQTRMGVEQVYTDYFTRAKEYAALKKSGKPYRRDLELDALQEIIEGQRFITCHSYVQSEITMMMRVAEQFGFKLNTFTHILEGYKVADKMAKHGAGGSTFSDWWAYKYEVYEAIPQNAKMMMDQKVVVAINSDDAEMARRLNQEAAKSVKYAGMKEADAWKMVTINPAKLLRVDDRVGSIKSGKDADLVLWNDNPLSVYAVAEKTWVDGALYFDRKEDEQLRQSVQTERARLIQKLQNAKKDGPGGERPSAPKGHYHCDTEGEEGE